MPQKIAKNTTVSLNNILFKSRNQGRKFWVTHNLRPRSGQETCNLSMRGCPSCCVVVCLEIHRPLMGNNSKVSRALSRRAWIIFQNIVVNPQSLLNSKWYTISTSLEQFFKLCQRETKGLNGLKKQNPWQVKLHLHNAYRDVHFWKLSPLHSNSQAKVFNMAVCSQEEDPEGNGWCSIKHSGDGADFEKEARAAEMRARPHYEVGHANCNSSFHGALRPVFPQVGTLEIDSGMPAAQKYLERFTWSNPDHIWEEFEAPRECCKQFGNMTTALELSGSFLGHGHLFRFHPSETFQAWATWWWSFFFFHLRNFVEPPRNVPCMVL